MRHYAYPDVTWHYLLEGIDSTKLTSTNKYITSTVVFNFLIVIGAGHGIGTLGLVGILWLPNILTGEFNFVLFGEYQESLAANAVVSLVGQALFLAALFGQRKKYLVLPGATIMLLSFISLTHTISFDSLATIGLITGIPFLISLGILLLKIWKNKDAM